MLERIRASTIEANLGYIRSREGGGRGKNKEKGRKTEGKGRKKEDSKYTGKGKARQRADTAGMFRV